MVVAEADVAVVDDVNVNVVVVVEKVDNGMSSVDENGLKDETAFSESKWFSEGQKKSGQSYDEGRQGCHSCGRHEEVSISHLSL